MELYRALLSDSLALLSRLRRQDRGVEACLDGPWSPDRDLFPGAEDIPRAEQGPGDLGERLERMFHRCHGEGMARTVVIGADSPTLPSSIVDEAFERLREGADAVVSPAADGGYVLVGVRGEPPSALFRDVPWGDANVLRTTRDRAVESGIVLVEVPPWYDVDDFHSLERLIRDLDDPHTAENCPATVRALRRRTG